MTGQQPTTAAETFQLVTEQLDPWTDHGMEVAWDVLKRLGQTFGEIEQPTRWDADEVIVSRRTIGDMSSLLGALAAVYEPAIEYLAEQEVGSEGIKSLAEILDAIQRGEYQQDHHWRAALALSVLHLASGEVTDDSRSLAVSIATEALKGTNDQDVTDVSYEELQDVVHDLPKDTLAQIQSVFDGEL